MKRPERLKLIEEIINGSNISSQDEIIRIMEDLGIKCTQATLSRDLRHIGVARISNDRGTPIYRVIRSGQVSGRIATEIYHRAIIELLWSRELLIIKTSPGFAAGVASTIDNAGKEGIAGTIAGDDTILLIPLEGYSRACIMKSLREVFPGIDALIKV